MGSERVEDVRLKDQEEMGALYFEKAKVKSLTICVLGLPSKRKRGCEERAGRKSPNSLCGLETQ